VRTVNAALSASLQATTSQIRHGKDQWYKSGVVLPRD